MGILVTASLVKRWIATLGDGSVSNHDSANAFSRSRNDCAIRIREVFWKLDFLIQEMSSQMKTRFFSQEMASSSSHNNGIPLATQLEWYKIRDTFFGLNGVNQNIPLAD
jgi:hypothetical protein